MKKKTFSIPFKSNFFKEQDPFHLVIVFFIVFFSTAIFFSVPTFYDYEKYNQKIQDTINKEFKINIYNLEKISFKFIPSPHLVVKKAKFKIKNNEPDSIAELNNLKIFISIIDLYKSEKFKIKKMVINKANFYFRELSFYNLIQNLKKNIVNNLLIKNSTFFFKDKKDEVILISKIRNLEYKIDLNNYKKIFNVYGNVFDADYELNYLIDYSTPDTQNFRIEFKNPNLLVENELKENISPLANQQLGNLKFVFLNQKNILNYKIEDNNINFSNINTKNSNFDLNGLVNFSPFYFDLVLDIKKIELTSIEKIFYYIYKNQNSAFENLSGVAKINFNQIDNKIVNKGEVDLHFQDSKINLKNKNFFINNFAEISVNEYEYLDNSEQVIQMKIEVDIKNLEKFNRFIHSYKKNKFLNKKLYLTYQFNVLTRENFMSEISSDSFSNSGEFYKFKNALQLKNLLKDESVMNLD